MEGDRFWKAEEHAGTRRQMGPTLGLSAVTDGLPGGFRFLDFFVEHNPVHCASFLSTQYVQYEQERITSKGNLTADNIFSQISEELCLYKIV